MEKSALSNLADATSSWLTFHHNCRFDEMLRESSLVTPIGFFLTSNLKSSKISVEYDHPNFASSSVGRSRQIDFAIRNSKDTLSDVIETKWAPGPTDAIFDDILRMVCLKAKGAKVLRYILISGLEGNIDILKDRGINLTGARKPIHKILLSFDLKDPQRIVDFANCDEKILAKGKRFYQDYIKGKSVDVGVPSAFVTELVARQGTKKYSTLIWKLKRRQGVNDYSFQKVK